MSNLEVYNGSTGKYRDVAEDNGLPVTLVGSNGIDTELPAAAALADAAANPTTPLVGACLLGYNGATYDRVRTALSNGGGLTTGAPAAVMHLWDGSGFQSVANVGQLLDAGGAANDAHLPPQVPLLWGGSAYGRERQVTTLKSAKSDAVASGSDLTVWTPAAGKKFRLRGLCARASNAGRYEVRDGSGTVIAYVYLAANTWTELLNMDANGSLSAAANNALLLRNQSGGASDVDALAFGNEE